MQLSPRVVSSTHTLELRPREKSAFDVKVVECEITAAAERWREVIRFLLEVDSAQ